MSMDEMLMNELYGSEEVQQEEQIKQAQVELVEAVAAEAGVDLNELDDDELAKFAHYVLSDEDESADVDSSDDTENNTKIASLEEADLMGRQMAHSYVDELNQIQNGDTTMNRDTLTKVASAMEDVAQAWDMEQQNNALPAHEEEEKTASVSDILARELEKVASDVQPAGGSTSAKSSMFDSLKDKAGKAGKYVADRKGKFGAGAAGLLALGGGAMYMKNRKKKKAAQEKKASLFMDAGYEALALIELCEPEEFAKEAEFRAAEILAANGVHPETFEDIEPEAIKIASFPGVEHAADEYEAAALEEYNEMLDTAAMHIIENLLDD